MPTDKRSSRKLKAELRFAGLSDGAIQAAWPVWWSQDAEGSSSAQAELRFALARKLGLSAPALLGDRVEFVWKDQAKFKHLADEQGFQQWALTSFGVSLGQLLFQASPGPTSSPSEVGASNLRNTILGQQEFVDLRGLLIMCWAIGIPVIHPRVFPLKTKSMHAMAVRSSTRHAILLGRDANYPAQIAFDLAHELGHILLGHLSNTIAIVDTKDPILPPEDSDQDEEDADQFALLLLTGQTEPDIRTNVVRFSARQLARAADANGRSRRVEPGTLALCAAYRTNAWPTAIAALKIIYTAPRPVWEEVNRYASTQIAWNEFGEDNADYLEQIMGVPRA